MLRKNRYLSQISEPEILLIYRKRNLFVTNKEMKR